VRWQTINTAVCSMIQSAVAEPFTELLGDVYDFIHPELSLNGPLHGESEVVAAAIADRDFFSTPLVDFNRHSIFRRLVPEVDALLAATLDDGRARVSLYVDALTNNTGTLSLAQFLGVSALDVPITSSATDYADVHLNITNAKIGGLDTIRAFDLFTPLRYHFATFQPGCASNATAYKSPARTCAAVPTRFAWLTPRRASILRSTST
jgi:hypothetical protein